ncbi:MAG: 3-oxoacyl-ACP synthase III [Actinomycetota bacterium]|nr:3-oxoacyl-ACP synthase III [Actinomycetota bacterium]
MSGNATFRFTDTAVLSVTVAEAPIVVTSDEFDAQLADTYARVGLRPGMLEALAGIAERRWWPEDVSFADAAAMAGAKAIAEAGIDPAAVGLLIDTSVCRDHLEPSAAVDVHEQLGLGTACLNFDLSNACLGFVNGMQLAGMMIDTGQVDYALIVDGEGARRTQLATIARLQRPETTRDDVLDNFASLTLGSGGAAMVLGRASTHAEGHRFVGGVARAATQYNTLCIGDLDEMRTDSRALLDAGVELARDAWADALVEFDWTNLDAYVIHQVSQVHTAAITSALGIDPGRTPVIFRTRGNVGPASIPFTLALHSADFESGQRIGCMGIGSGLNAAVVEIAW